MSRSFQFKPKIIVLLCWIFTSENFVVGLPFSVTNVGKLFPIEQWKAPEETSRGLKFGKLKLCPPGGRSFLEAFQLACPMRRKRSPLPRLFDFGSDPFYRPATIDEIMQICCLKGCELSDLFNYCGPFGTWN
ncbi:hypothetical protein M3Y98_00275100 [Aphelenchoides besseyi]|nr:hypothetical protein M3Y98_00275100 [Aphelenchoides besseyi]KAI6200988.1 hypothetical protein M3Y96_00793100 [Aphelenchoides besseyi]